MTIRPNYIVLHKLLFVKLQRNKTDTWLHSTCQGCDLHFQHEYWQLLSPNAISCTIYQYTNIIEPQTWSTWTRQYLMHTPLMHQHSLLLTHQMNGSDWGTFMTNYFNGAIISTQSGQSKESSNEDLCYYTCWIISLSVKQKPAGSKWLSLENVYKWQWLLISQTEREGINLKC